jgi:hypothetical protein
MIDIAAVGLVCPIDRLMRLVAGACGRRQPRWAVVQYSATSQGWTSNQTAQAQRAGRPCDMDPCAICRSWIGYCGTVRVLRHSSGRTERAGQETAGLRAERQTGPRCTTPPSWYSEFNHVATSGRLHIRTDIVLPAVWLTCWPWCSIAEPQVLAVPCSRTPIEGCMQ